MKQKTPRLHDALDPPLDCPLCPRLSNYRTRLRELNPSWHNAPVPAFAAPDARLLIVGLAPGKEGANRTGRVFTGDKAGDALFSMLDEFSFSSGVYGGTAGDGVQLRDCAITNAVACAPPDHKPCSQEIATCREFLANRIRAMKSLRAILVLGEDAHKSTLKVFGVPCRRMPFDHGAPYNLEGGIRLFVSYHCSQRNINRGLLRVGHNELGELQGVFASVRKYLDAEGAPARP